MRIPVTFGSLKTQALVDTGAAASFLAHRLLVHIPYNDIKELQDYDHNIQLFRTVSGEVVKPLGRYELNIRLARRHPFTHPFYVIADLDEGCILGYCKDPSTAASKRRRYFRKFFNLLIFFLFLGTEPFL